MSDKKISQLASVTNLIGTELVPIVQGGNTVRTMIGSINKLAKTYLTITKALADTLIAGNNLIPGSYYKITGVNPILYNDGTNSGTAVILQAISPNQFATGGHGIFYNPKYNQSIDGFGVWSNRSTWVTLLTSVNTFNINELITGNGGQTGQLFIYLETNVFIALTGDWTTATSITGDVSGATADISSIVVKSYVFGEKVIWGGYSWVNVTGNVGSKLDILTLNADWTKVHYSLTDYNLVNDIITYDYQNDFISSRLEVNGGNYVEASFNGGWSEEHFTLPISVFMWGNPYNWDNGKGIGYNNSVGSWFECVDFCGITVSNNTLITSTISNNTTLSSIVISNNILNSGTIVNNNLGGGSITQNILNNSSIDSNNLFINSNIQGNTFNYSSFWGNTLINSCAILANTFDNGSTIHNMTLNTSCNIRYNTFSKSNFVATNIIIEKVLQLTHFNGVNVNEDFSLSTIIFGGYTKNVFSRQDGTPKLSYFDNTDTLVVVNVNA